MGFPLEKDLPMNHPRIPRIPRMSHKPRFSRNLLILGFAGLAFLAAGCASGDRSRGMNEPYVSPQTRALDSSLLIGPSKARDLGYRVDWQYPVAGPNIKFLTVHGDSVFTMDEKNYLTRIDREDGTRVWRIPVSYPLAEIQGITYLPNYQKVLVTSGGALFVLNSSDGSQIDKQTLKNIANTEPIALGEHILYGSRNGQLTWHSHLIAFHFRGYQVARSINVKPILRGNVAVVAGNDGEIMVLDINSASQYWNKKLLDGIVAEPTIGNGAIYVAGLDQHLWAFDIGTGRNLWRYLTESPLVDSPVQIGDRVFQQVPTVGLVSFEALPFSKPGGQIDWTNPDVSGNVLTQRNGNLFCWDDTNKKLNVITALRGGNVSTLDLPNIDILLASSLNEGEFYASDRDGKIIRLVPRD